MEDHHEATEGEDDFEGDDDEEREEMKSETMARWAGVNDPYQMRFTETLPARSGPLWYWNAIGESSVESPPESCLDAEATLNRTKRDNMGSWKALLRNAMTEFE
ncbi:hypothetical protein Droror1_Dr00004991 [Drosera rotundifolia]